MVYIKAFYNPSLTPYIVGAVLAGLTGYCLLGGGKRIVRLTGTVVPLMGISYVIVALIVILLNFQNIPSMFALIFRDAFDFRSIAGGVVGSCLVYVIKRGLFSNEAGVGSAPNASASAKVSHPAKQGLVQTLSVYIDTLLLCSATALMCLSSGVARDAAWAMADITMGAMALINLPVCMLMGKIAFDCLKDYERQKKSGKNPVFRPSAIGLDERMLNHWK